MSAAPNSSSALPFDPTDPVALTQALVRCPSVTPATGDVFTVLEGMLKPLGFTVDRFWPERRRTDRWKTCWHGGQPDLAGILPLPGIWTWFRRAMAGRAILSGQRYAATCFTGAAPST